MERLSARAVRAPDGLFDRPPRRVLWGVAPTGDPHLGYLLPILVLQRLRSAGSEIVPLIANWHGYLDAGKTEWSHVQARTEVYRAWFASVGFGAVRETNEFYGTREYVELLFRASAELAVSSTLAAGGTTLRRGAGDERVADLLYVATQIIDVPFLGVDCALCGDDESPIYELGLPLVERALAHPCFGAYVAMAPGIVAPEMHASSAAENRISFGDPLAEIERKVRIHIELAPSLESAPLARFFAGPIADVGAVPAETKALAHAISARDRRGVTEALTNAIAQALALARGGGR